MLLLFCNNSTVFSVLYIYFTWSRDISGSSLCRCWPNPTCPECLWRVSCEKITILFLSLWAFWMISRNPKGFIQSYTGHTTLTNKCQKITLKLIWFHSKTIRHRLLKKAQTFLRCCKVHDYPHMNIFLTNS